MQLIESRNEVRAKATELQKKLSEYETEYREGTECYTLINEEKDVLESTIHKHVRTMKEGRMCFMDLLHEKKVKLEVLTNKLNYLKHKFSMHPDKGAPNYHETSKSFMRLKMKRNLR